MCKRLNARRPQDGGPAALPPQGVHADRIARDLTLGVVRNADADKRNVRVRLRAVGGIDERLGVFRILQVPERAAGHQDGKMMRHADQLRVRLAAAACPLQAVVTLGQEDDFVFVDGFLEGGGVIRSSVAGGVVRRELHIAAPGVSQVGAAAGQIWRERKSAGGAAWAIRTNSGMRSPWMEGYSLNWYSRYGDGFTAQA